MERLPQVSAELATFSSHQQEANIVADRLEKILARLDLVDKELPTGQEVAGLEPVGVVPNAPAHSKSIEITAIRTDELIPALELFTPAFRTGLRFLDKDKGVHVSRQAVCWLSSEFHEIVGEIHRAAARSHAHFLADEREYGRDLSDALMPRRFHRHTDLPKSSMKDNSRTQLSSPPDITESRSYDGTVLTTAGKLYAYFEGTHWSKEWPFGNSKSGRVSMSFIPRFELGLPGIGVVFMKESESLQPSHHAFLTTFTVLPGNAPIIRAVKDGDRGVSRVLQKLKAGEAWAGDRDENGRSLLSVSIPLFGM
jgi:hypothetical protein